ncbi:MAG: hypothetical protein KKB29_00260 [Nanoarchaeota archaeon]|nr:hypothetical protein [Nanoarchaeota archaeon]
MAREKKVKKRSSVKRASVKRASAGKSSSLSTRFNVARKNFSLFLVLFIFSFTLYNFSTSELFLTFFGILSVILAFLALAFLIAFVVLFISNKKK